MLMLYSVEENSPLKDREIGGCNNICPHRVRLLELYLAILQYTMYLLMDHLLDIQYF